MEESTSDRLQHSFLYLKRNHNMPLFLSPAPDLIKGRVMECVSDLGFCRGKWGEVSHLPLGVKCITEACGDGLSEAMGGRFDFLAR